MKTGTGFIFKYLLWSGVFAQVIFMLVVISFPNVVEKVLSKGLSQYYAWQIEHEYQQLTQNNALDIESEISQVFIKWIPFSEKMTMPSNFLVNDKEFAELPLALQELNDGDTLFISPGIYQTPMIITQDNITIEGVGHVIFEGATAQNKGFILAKGNNLTVINIECRNIAVRDGNGACIRQEGVNLTLNHVFFHHSQEGLLETSKEEGFVDIYDSRFEQLGFNGQAHGLYTNKASVTINQSLFIATKDQGHAVKVRGKKLSVKNTIIASLSSDDSRLIDMPNGGELLINSSLLSQGPNSINGQMIGFGLEGVTHTINKVEFTNNLVFLERIGSNYLLAVPKKGDRIKINQSNNTIVGKDDSIHLTSSNNYFKSREELGLAIYPYLPKEFCKSWCVN